MVYSGLRKVILLDMLQSTGGLYGEELANLKTIMSRFQNLLERDEQGKVRKGTLQTGSCL